MNRVLDLLFRSNIHSWQAHIPFIYFPGESPQLAWVTALPTAMNYHFVKVLAQNRQSLTKRFNIPSFITNIQSAAVQRLMPPLHTDKCLALTGDSQYVLHAL